MKDWKKRLAKQISSENALIQNQAVVQMLPLAVTIWLAKQVHFPCCVALD